MTKVQAPWRKSKKGLVTKLYGRQCENSIKRGHNAPTYTRDELKEWLYSQKLFHLLYDNWSRLDFQSDYAPSVDRKEDSIGYTMNNIQLMTWKENYKKACSDRKSGVNNCSNKAVVQMDLDGNIIGEFHSTSSSRSILC